jgi:hypothetical protein
VGGQLYYRTASDASLNRPYAIPAVDATVVTLPYQNFSDPRIMTVTSDTYKRDLYSLADVDSRIRAGTKIMFTTKILIDGEWYARTDHDTRNGYHKGVRLSLLRS